MRIIKNIHFAQIIEQKIYRRRRKLRKNKQTNRYVHGFDNVGTVRMYYTKFIHTLSASGYIDLKFAKRIIYVPEKFSFKEDFDNSMLFFKEVVSSYILSKGTITISFERCRLSSIANLTLLNVILVELAEMKTHYNKFKYSICNRNIKIEHSKYDIRTNKYLYSYFNIKLPKEQDDGSYFVKLKLQKGKQKSYKENQKSKVSAVVVDFVNKSTEEAGASLKLLGRRAIEGLLGEVLGNAEDHSAPNSYWYVDAISFVEKQDNTNIVDLNLTIMNIGLSMYEGFEATKKDNHDNYQKCQDLFNIHQSQFSFKESFNRESLFSMYLLNDGISRLKYKDKSRGNGTIKFLESFITLGSYGTENPKFKCQLNVISGHTTITCDNDMHSFKVDGINILSLNKEKDITKLPDKKYLSYNKEYFPGTILECHIYLNKEFFQKNM